jgi:hypothetical protein
LANGQNVGAGLGRGENIGNSKSAAASKVIDMLRRDGSSYVHGLVESYLDLSSAYIDLADAPTKHLLSKGVKTKDIPFSKALNRVQKPLDRCLKGRSFVPCVLTSPPILRAGKDYGDGLDDPIGAERIAGFEPFFNITDTGTPQKGFARQMLLARALTYCACILGIHRPKIVVCIGSQGGRYRQIVKGEDDIRQDAIMSQVFSYVNILMDRCDDRKTLDHTSVGVGPKRSRRKLKMITYNILPLNPTSGVSEQVKHVKFIVSVV